MENFPTKSFRSQGALRFLRAFSSEVGKRVVAVELERASAGPDSAIVEYAHLVINHTDGSVSSGWGLLNPKTTIDETMSRHHQVYAADVEGKPTIDAYVDKLTELYKGSIIIGGQGAQETWHTLRQALVNAGADQKSLDTVRILDLTKLGVDSAQLSSSDTVQTFDRVMLACGQLSSYLFKNGASAVLDQLANTGPREQAKPSNNHDHVDSNLATKATAARVEVGNTASAEAGTQSSRIKDWLNARIENNEIFPSWSQKFLIEKLQQRSPMPGGPVDPTAAAFGFALSDALKTGALPPSSLIHPGLMKAMVPTLASLLEKPQLTLTEAQTSLAEQTSRTFDYPMIRAALMILGHPLYGVSKKGSQPSAGGEKKPNKSSSMSM